MNKPKSRLGRGLSSLISVSSEEAEAPATTVAVAPERRTLERIVPVMKSLPVESQPQPPAGAAIAELPLDSIVPNPHQPRRQMNDASIGELAQSLKTTGLIQPIVVRKVGEQYQLIAGERRWRAAKVAGLVKVPAIIREADSFEQAQMALIENVQRESLNPIDRALAYKSLVTQLGLTQAELAARMGEDRSSIANHLRLLDLPAAVQAMVTDGRLSLGHAKILAGVPDPVDQERLANIVVNQSLSVRNLERQIADTSQPPAAKSAKDSGTPSAHVADLEKSIARQLGLRAQLRSAAKKGSGRLILHYASLDQFDELLSRLGVKVD
ncbi:MAG TPA: ParB/RepB/Spo0J family partition protein [Humisphaera sp.]|jgi:ParB family chromosome partitioning protein|nr:ParB/RepB/Spo0J family partition protein [Humisphaera sp.]